MRCFRTHTSGAGKFCHQHTAPQCDACTTHSNALPYLHAVSYVHSAAYLNNYAHIDTDENAHSSPFTVCNENPASHGYAHADTRAHFNPHFCTNEHPSTHGHSWSN